MKQNKYDDPRFFDAYRSMGRSTGGLEEAGEWPAFRSLVPDPAGKRVLDLGCGFGWHCRYLAEAGAATIIGVDLSEKMLARAGEINAHDRIAYRHSAIEDVAFEDNAFDLVVSSLAFHYVDDFAAVFRRIHQWLSQRGDFVFSVEHPIFTAREAQDWYADSSGRRLHWPVDDYQRQGARHTHWLADDVVKYHRTVESYVNAVLDAGFTLNRLCEPVPDREQIARHPEWIDEVRRPMFLMISARKSGHLDPVVGPGVLFR